MLNNAGWLEAKLTNPKLYRDTILALHRKHSNQPYGRLYQHNADEVAFYTLFSQRGKVARLLADAVADHSYAPGIASKVTLVKREKQRVFYQVPRIDRIMHSAVYDILLPLHQLLPDCLYGFIPGRGRFTVYQKLKRYIADYRLRIPDKTQQGLYVFQTDISAYGESIPVDQQSSLWGGFEQLYAQHTGCRFNAFEQLLLQQLLRPILKQEEEQYCPLRGIPDGLPISSILMNVYLLPLDQQLNAIDGGFYARFGDDILFIHPQRAQCEEAAALFHASLSQLRLQSNPNKTSLNYFNNAGKAKQDITGTPHITYLGAQLDFSGRTYLTTRKLKEFRSELKARIAIAHQASVKWPRSQHIQHVVSAVNNAINDTHPSAISQLEELYLLVDDRAYYKQLDYWIALTVSSAITGINSAVTFRKLRYATLRRQYQLHSLVHGVNQAYSR